MPVPPDIARLIHEALTLLGGDADAEDVARAVRRLDHGLPAEDEFSVVCAWLGRCELIHKLDQQQTPLSSRDRLQVPDLLAKFADAPPVLVEVKVCNDRTLSFKPDYCRRLAAYAELLEMPLLIAWKFHSVWLLFEFGHARLARVNHNIAIGEAMRQNLMGVLAGDVSYVPAPGAGVHFNVAKEELLKDCHDEDGARTDTWTMRLKAVEFTKAGGEPAILHPEVAQLFTTIDLESTEHHSADAIRTSFYVGEETGSQFAHRALVGLLKWESQAGERADWRQLLSASHIVRSIGDFGTALSQAIEEDVVRYVFHQQPAIMPVFLERVAPPKLRK